MSLFLRSCSLLLRAHTTPGGGPLCAWRVVNLSPGQCPASPPWPLMSARDNAADQRRYKYGHKTKRSWSQRIFKNCKGQFEAYHAAYRHKRYNKSTSQLGRLKKKFVLPDFLQRKLKKAGF